MLPLKKDANPSTSQPVTTINGILDNVPRDIWRIIFIKYVNIESLREWLGFRRVCWAFKRVAHDSLILNQLLSQNPQKIKTKIKVALSILSKYGQHIDYPTVNLSDLEIIRPEEIRPLGYVKNLIRLDLSHTKINDESLMCLAPLTKLRQLDVPYGEFTDDSWKIIATLTNLVSLNVAHCDKFSVKGLQNVSCLVLLKYLNLRGCWQVNGEMMPSLMALSALEELNLAQCRNLKKPNHVTFGYPSALTRLDLGSNPHLRDDMLEPMTALTRLTLLDLSGNKKMNGTGFMYLRSLTSLQCLKADRTDLNPSNITFFASLNLKELHMRECRFNDEEIPYVARLASLRFLALGLEINSGESLQCSTALTNLETLILSHFRNIPNEAFSNIGLLTTLTSLDVTQCSRTLTPEMFHLTNLANLRFLYCQSIQITSELQALLKQELPKLEIKKSYFRPARL